MIKQERERIRTTTEQLMLQEMVDEDNDFLIVNEAGDDIDRLADELNKGIFDADEEEDDALVDLDDDEYDDILGI